MVPTSGPRATLPDMALVSVPLLALLSVQLHAPGPFESCLFARTAAFVPPPRSKSTCMVTRWSSKKCLVYIIGDSQKKKNLRTYNSVSVTCLLMRNDPAGDDAFVL